MSIATEIQRIEAAKSSIRSAIVNKGVTVPVDALIGTYPNYIAQISGGGAVSDPYQDFVYDAKIAYNTGALSAAEGYCVSRMLPIQNSCRSITWKYQNDSAAGSGVYLLVLSNLQARVDYFSATVSPRTINHTKTNVYWVRACFLTADIDDCYIYDNTNQVYVWKGLNVV